MQCGLQIAGKFVCLHPDSGVMMMISCPHSRLEQMGLSPRFATWGDSRQWNGSTINLLLWQPWSCWRRGQTTPLGRDFSPLVQWPSFRCVIPTHTALHTYLCCTHYPPPPQQLSENLSSLVWSTSPDHAKRLVAMGNTEFVDALNSALVSVFCC